MTPTFTSATRLYDLAWRDKAPGEFSVEAWWGREKLSGGFEFVIDLLSPDAYLELKTLMGKAVSLLTRLSDGKDTPRTGLVRAAQKLGADGGFARYRIAVVPWIWLLGRGRHNRVFQDKSVRQIVDDVFDRYRDVAAWTWHPDIDSFLADARPRSYCVQYGESDYAFVSRLLAEEGLGWCVEEDDKAPAGHRLRLFADSRRFPEDPLSESANGGQGIRYHRADSQEDQDSITAFGEQRRFDIGQFAAVAYDYKAKRTVTLNVPSAETVGGEHAPVIESYDHAGLYAWANAAEAERYGRLLMEARESRRQTWLGRGTVRTLRPGSHFDLIGLPSQPGASNQGEEARFTATDILHAGINNLVGDSIAAIAQRLARRQIIDDAAALATGDALHPVGAPDAIPDSLLDLVQQRGYGNAFDAHALARPWRPILEDDSGAPNSASLNPRPTAPGPMTAIVVGPQGETSPKGADELWCDALGRVKIRFHWQQGEAEDDRDSCWLRVLSRQAGAGMGWQCLPRIGQEVLVGFMDGDIDRPLVWGALFNGQGEGARAIGTAPTPGGAESTAPAADVFTPATDHRPAGQGNLAGGQSPAWHGAAPENHRQPAALSGFRSKEFGGAGYNQWVLDDSDRQQRIQLASTQHASQLNLGHLIHQADNYRGSFRGAGIELRTDAWGALRAGQGLVMSTWAVDTALPAGDMAPAMALLKQADTLAQTLDRAAATHRSVRLASALGTAGPGRCLIDPAAAPLAALHKASSGRVDAAAFPAAQADARQKQTAGGQNKLPHLTDPALIQAGKAGFGSIAGQHLQYANGESFVLASGEDSNLAIAGKLRLHTGQAIGLVTGAIGAGEGNTGFKLIAAQDDIDLQAQSDAFSLQAQQNLTLVSAHANIDFAAARKIVISVAGGASIAIDGGITVQCPGTITVHAGKKSFGGPTSLSREMNSWPKTNFNDAYVIRNPATGEPLANTMVEVTRGDGSKLKVMTDASGKTPIQKSDLLEQIKIRLLD